MFVRDEDETQMNITVAEGAQESPFHTHFLWQVNVISIIYRPKQAKSITAQMCFAQGYVKSALNTITLPRLAWGE